GWCSHRKQTSRTRRPRRSFVPRLMVLEDRTVPNTYTVTNLASSGAGSLQQAVLDAKGHPGADLIKFAGGLQGTITPASELSVTDDLTIDGPGAGKITVSGGNARRVFHASGATTDVAINRLTIANGLASVPAGPAFGGGLLNDGASVSLSKVILANNKAQSVGGYPGGRAGAHPRGGPPTGRPHPLPRPPP